MNKERIKWWLRENKELIIGVGLVALGVTGVVIGVKAGSSTRNLDKLGKSDDEKLFTDFPKAINECREGCTYCLSVGKDFMKVNGPFMVHDDSGHLLDVKDILLFGNIVEE